MIDYSGLARKIAFMKRRLDFLKDGLDNLYRTLHITRLT